MVAGFEVRGSHGIFQIIDNEPTLQWKEKRVLTSQYTGSAYPPEQVVTITASSRAVFVLHSTSPGCAVGFAQYNGTVWTLYVFTAAVDPALLTFELHVFDAYLPATAGPGLQVFDSAGRIVFDHGRRPLDITSANLSKWGWITNRVGMSGAYVDGTVTRRLIELSACEGQTLKSGYRQFGIAPIPLEDYPGVGIYLTKVNLEGL